MKIEYLKDGNVVTLASARRERKFPAIAQIEAYWHGLRNGRLMPTRSDVDPRGIADNLSYAFVLERIAPGMARIRLAGQHVNDLLGMEVRGMPITAFFLPQSRTEFQEALESVFETPSQVTLSMRGDAGMFRGTLDAQMVLLPLKDNEGRVTRVLGAMQVLGKLGRGPHRFEIRSLESQPLVADRPNVLADERATHGKHTASGYGDWDVSSANDDETDVTRVDIRPARASGEDTNVGGHTMRPSSGSGQQVPGFAELAETFRAAKNRKDNRPAAPRPGGHLRLITTD